MKSISHKTATAGLLLNSTFQWGCRYTEAGLKGLSSLKAKDRQVGNVLQAVAASGCLDVYLAFISKEEQCSAEIVKRKWEVTEVFETSWAARDWLSLDGTKPTFYETDIDTNHIMQVPAMACYCILSVQLFCASLLWGELEKDVLLPCWCICAAVLMHSLSCCFTNAMHVCCCAGFGV